MGPDEHRREAPDVGVYSVITMKLESKVLTLYRLL